MTIYGHILCITSYRVNMALAATCDHGFSILHPDLQHKPACACVHTSKSSPLPIGPYAIYPPGFIFIYGFCNAFFIFASGLACYFVPKYALPPLLGSFFHCSFEASTS